MIIDLIFLAFSLGIDAFFVALSICLMLQNKSINKLIIFSLLAAFFQAFMPAVGYLITYFLSSKYMQFIQMIDHYLVFVIFAYLAYKLFKDYLDKSSEEIDISYKSIFLLSIATSIDALGAGLMIFSLNYNIYYSALLIAFITFIMCVSALLINKINFNNKLLQPFGSVLLLFLAIKIVIIHTLEHI